jgi:MFS family permease
VDKAHLGRAFGFHRTGDNIGAVVGPGIALIGLAILDGDVREVAKWALIPAIISGLLTLLIKESFVKVPRVKAEKKLHPRLPKALKRSISILVLIQLTNIPDLLLLLRLHDIGFSTQGVVLSYMLFSGVTVLAAFPGGYIADKFSPRVVYAFGLLAFAAAYATLGLTQNHTLALIALVVYGLFPAFTDGVGKAWIASLSEDNHRGRAQGVYQASMNFAVLGAGIWGGALWSSGDIQWPLIFAAVGALIGSITLAINHLRRVQS